MPLRDLEKVLGETLFEGAPDHSPLDERLVPAVSDYVRRHYSIRCGDEHLELVFGEATFRDLASGPYLFADYSAPRPVERPCRLEVSYDAIIESMPGREAIVFALISRGWAGLYRHEETRLEFDGDHQTRSIDLLVPSMSENARASLGRAAKLLRGKAKGAARRIRAIAR